MLSFRLGAPTRIATEMVRLLLDTIEGGQPAAITLPTTLVRCEHLTADGPLGDIVYSRRASVALGLEG
jgi:hypothetical protein